MRIVITGIAGFIGSRFAQWVLENNPGVEIVGFDDLSCGYNENVPKDIPWAKVDLASDAILTYDPADYFFHFAAYAAEGLSPFIRKYNYTNNLLATANVVNYCINQNVKRLVFTSSMAVYGRGVQPFDERDAMNPIDPYGIAKMACEMDIRVAGEQHGLDWCILRPHNVYGPGQSIWQKYRNVLGIWMARGFQRQPLLVFGDGQQQRAFSYIDDILPCIWQAAVAPQASKEVINIGGASPITIAEAAGETARVLHEKFGLIPKVNLADGRHEVKAAYCTTQKSVDLLGYNERTGLREGIQKMARWARDAWVQFPERRKMKTIQNIEVKKGLYSQWSELLE